MMSLLYNPLCYPMKPSVLYSYCTMTVCINIELCMGSAGLCELAHTAVYRHCFQFVVITILPSLAVYGCVWLIVVLSLSLGHVRVM